MKIITMTETLDKDLSRPRMLDDNTIIFITSKSEQNRRIDYTGIIKKHLNKNTLNYYEFIKPAFYISDIFESSIFYLTYSEDFKNLIINKFNLYSNIENQVVVIPFIAGKNIITIHTMNHRYILVGIKDLSNRKFGDIYYKSLFLVDSIEEKYYSVPESFIEDETIFNLTMVAKYNIESDREYLLLETGRIAPSEKKYFWEKGSMNYHPQIQVMAIVDLEEYVDSIKKGMFFKEFKIIDYSDRNSTFFKVPLIEKNIFSFIKVDFLKNKTYSMQYNIDTGEKKIILTLDGLYEDIYEINNEFYLVPFLNHGYRIIKSNGDVIFNSEQNIQVFEIRDNILSYATYDIYTEIRENILFDLLTKDKLVFFKGDLMHLKDDIYFNCNYE